MKYFLITYRIGPCDQEPYRETEDNKNELIKAHNEDEAKHIFEVRHKDSGIDILKVTQLS